MKNERSLFTAYEQPALPKPIVRHLGNLKHKRETQSVWHDEKTGIWHIYRYSDVLRVLTDAKGFGAPRSSGSYFPAFSAFSQSLSMVGQRQAVVYKPDPVGLFLREALTPRTVSRMKPYVARTAGELLDPLLSAGKLEGMTQLAWPLATHVIDELAGILLEEGERLYSSPADFALLASSIASQGRYDSRSGPESQPDLTGRLFSIGLEGDRLTGDGVATSCYLFMAAVRQVLADTLGNTVLLLSLQPDVLRRLHREPAPLYSTVEEALRYLPAAWTAHRTVLAPVVLAGQELPQGAHVCAWLVSANHDPEQFDHPERFDIDRIPNRHLTFADEGSFSNLGSGLARLVARLTLAAVAQRISGMALAPEQAVEIASAGEPGEREEAQTWVELGEQTLTSTGLPTRCGLLRLPIVFEARD